jgi:hypothetical protein
MAAPACSGVNASASNEAVSGTSLPPDDAPRQTAAVTFTVGSFGQLRAENEEPLVEVTRCDHSHDLWQHFIQPDAWSILANLMYWLLLIVITLAKVISLAVVAFGLIANAVCAVVGPIFVPFFIVPRLDWLFWSWFAAIWFSTFFESHS